jgi:hypothetical protein
MFNSVNMGKIKTEQLEQLVECAFDHRKEGNERFNNGNGNLSTRFYNICTDLIRICNITSRSNYIIINVWNKEQIPESCA